MATRISSSSHRAPDGPWLRTWGLACLLLVVFFGSVEIVFRLRGMTPQYQDTPRLWAHWRAAASRSDNPVVLLGSSRTLLGLEPASMASVIGDRDVIQLAINGGTPFPVLSEIAADPSFRGTVIIEGSPTQMFLRDTKTEAATNPWVAYFLGRSSIDDVEVQLRLALQSTFVISRPDFRPTLFAVNLLVKGELPSQGYTEMHLSRWTEAHYDRRTGNLNTELRSKLVGPDLAGVFASLPVVDLAEFSRKIAREARAIEARGGRVVFVRMPSTGAIRALEEKYVPRSEYWDPFVRETGLAAIHFEDHPELQGFSQPDGHHLDGSEAPRFSVNLATLLERRGFFGAPSQ